MMRYPKQLFVLLTALLLAGTAIAGDKYEFCGNNNYSKKGERVFAKELRETTIPPTALLTVDGRKNGGINIKGENRTNILVRACVYSWGDSQEKADAAVKNTKIITSPVVKSENADEQAKYSVSYEVLVPRSANLKLTAYNGGIGISSVQGNLEFETHNGGVSLSDVGGNVKGSTRNGGISVKLGGDRWKGAGLDVETRNGGVNLSLPVNYAAQIETGTVNGGLRSDFKELQPEEKGRWQRNKQINASLNGGGPKIRVITTNGGINIKSSNN